MNFSLPTATILTRTRYNVRHMCGVYVVRIVRWIILAIVFIQHHPGKFLAVLFIWLPQFCCYTRTSTSSCTGVPVPLLWRRNYCGCAMQQCVLKRTASGTAKQTATCDAINSSTHVLYLRFCGGHHGDVAPWRLQEISDVSKMVQQWPFLEEDALMIVLP
jgi:hypothetical protein